MPITINLRHLEKKAVRLTGTVLPEELGIADLDEVIQAKFPLDYDLEIERSGSNLLISGQIHTQLACDCVRCLKNFNFVIDFPNYEAIVPLEGPEKVEIINDVVDLTPLVREDILLEFPQHPLCEPECGGLPPAGNKQKQPRTGASQPEDSSSAWAELNKLKFNR